MAKNGAEKFKFRTHMTLGSPEAETDQMLNRAFVDTGYMPVLEETSRPESIVVGRTGVGKTALLKRLEQLHSDTTVRINPTAVSLQYLSNSTIIPYLDDLGVHLNLFYKVLWKHILVVAILKHHYDLRSRQKEETFLTRIHSLFGESDKPKDEAIKYIRETGGEFWREPAKRVQEITEKLHEGVRAELGGDIGPLTAAVEAGKEADTTVREKLQKRTQKVANDVQVNRYEDAMRIIEEDILTDRQKPYFVVIDDLDKEWVDERFAYDLIANLIDVTGEFARIENISVVLALRTNIIERIQDEHTQRGQQREKKEVLYLPIKWTRSELTDLLDRRVRELVRGHYGQQLGLEDILPDRKISNTSALDFILDRTFMRPREFIAYLNSAIEKAVNRGALNWQIIREVEGEYSRARVRAIEDEWRENYPDIKYLLELFAEMEDGFRIDDVPQEDLLQLLHMANDEGGERWLTAYLSQFAYEEGWHWTDAAEAIIRALYKCSVFGIKINSGSPVEYVYETPDLLQMGLRDDSIIYFHPALYKALGVKHPRKGIA